MSTIRQALHEVSTRNRPLRLRLGEFPFESSRGSTGTILGGHDMAGILREESGQGAFPGVLHCFSSSRALAETALELGLYISLSGIITFKNAGDLRDIARDVPIDRLLVETDAPFLAPVPKRGKRNEPGFVVHTARAAAEIKGVPEDKFARITSDNFFRLFAKAAKAA